MAIEADRRESENHPYIGRLSDFDDYEVADQDPDVRGWDVIGSDGTKYGEVDNLIVDRQEMKARYLEVELNDDLTPENEERHLLVPIGMASLDEDNNRVYLGDIDRATLTQVPAYDGGPITREYEQSVRTALRTDQYDATSRSAVTPPPSATGRVTTPAPVAGAPVARDEESPVDGEINPKPIEPREKGKTSDDFYARKSYDENAFYGNRRKPGRNDM